MKKSPIVSIVVPVAPGDDAYRDLCKAVVPLPSWAEMILVFTRKENLVADQSASKGFRKILCEENPGRASAMNMGARSANGTHLWFLHADSKLVPGSLDRLLQLASVESKGLWYFDLTFMRDGPPLMFVNAIGVWLRCRMFGMPFGDQGLFLSKGSFEQLGGYDEGAQYGEDHLFVWKARQSGFKIMPVGLTLKTSARRYGEHGWLRTTLRHFLLTWKQALPEMIKVFSGKRS